MVDPTRRQIMQMADEVGITDHAAAVRLVRRAFEVFRPAPVPVSERLPGDEDCDEEGRCWAWCCLAQAWSLFDRTSVFHRLDHWLPAHALPLPGGEVQP